MRSVRVRVAALLHSYTGGAAVIEVESGTAAEVMAALDRRFPGLVFRVIDEQGQVRPHMKIFVGEEMLRDLRTPVPPGSEIFIVGSLSGG